MPASLKFFNAKITVQLFYRIAALKWDLERVHKILGLPLCVPYAAICLETNKKLLSFRAWLLTIQFWLKLNFQAEPQSLTTHRLTESRLSPWLTHIEEKLSTTGMSLDYLASLSEQAYVMIKQRFLDIERQGFRESTASRCSPSTLGVIYTDYIAKYCIFYANCLSTSQSTYASTV